MDTYRIIIGILFLVVGVVLFLGAIALRLEMEKEVKGGRVVFWNSYLPYWNSKDFTERGNSFRKIYNVVYFVLIGYSVALIIFMKASE